MHWTRSLATVCTIALLAAPVWGQSEKPQKQGQRQAGRERKAALTSEQATTAWSWQARSASRALGLEETTTDTVVTMYGKSRKSLDDALGALRGAGDSGGAVDDGLSGLSGLGGLDDLGSIGDLAGAAGLSAGDITSTAREQLASALGGVLDVEQAQSAFSSLGTFSRRWDDMTNTIVGFDLDESSTFAALEPVRAYVAELGEVRRDGVGDREAMRNATVEARKKLSKGLAGTLDPAQIKQVEASMRRSRPQGQRGGGGEEKQIQNTGGQSGGA